MVNSSLSTLIDAATARFKSTWDHEATHCGYSPGRVNLIGDHVDYNDGFSLPMAIPAYVVMVGALSPNEQFTIETMSSDFEERTVRFTLDTLNTPSAPWSNYVKGVIANFPVKIRPFRAVINCNLPSGSGLSSSAALEAATILLLQALFDHKIESLLEQAQVCHKAETEFAGVPCGLMDQLVCLGGKEGHALLIDFRTFSVEYIPVTALQNASIVVANCNVKHEHASGEYSERKKACEQVASLLGKTSLRDISMRELESSKSVLPDDLYTIARHVITENERTLNACDALKRSDLTVFGTLMTQSHISLRDDYKVSCAELDELVELALEFDGVLGSRMTGGGFGGCTVTLVNRDKVSFLLNHLQSRFSGNVTLYVYSPVDGGGSKVLQQSSAKEST